MICEVAEGTITVVLVCTVMEPKSPVRIKTVVNVAIGVLSTEALVDVDTKGATRAPEDVVAGTAISLGIVPGKLMNLSATGVGVRSVSISPTKYSIGRAPMDNIINMIELIYKIYITQIETVFGYKANKLTQIYTLNAKLDHACDTNVVMFRVKPV